MALIPGINTADMWPIENSRMLFSAKRSTGCSVVTECRLQPSNRGTSIHPTGYRENDGCHFTIFNTGDMKYRAQFFYRGYRHFGTGIHELQSVRDCECRNSGKKRH